MTDKPFRISWKPGVIIVHAPSDKRAIDLMIEYLRQPGTNRIIVEPDSQTIMEDK